MSLPSNPSMATITTLLRAFGVIMRATFIASVVSLLAIGLAAAADVHAAIRRPVRIEPQSLSAALQELAKQREFQIVYRPEFVRDRTTAGAVGDFTSEEALRQLLTDTGLTYKYLDDKTITIFPTPSGRTSAKAAIAADSSLSDAEPSTDTQGGKSFWDRFRLAQVDQGPSVSDTATGGAGRADASGRLEEVLVTANRREERAQDVASSIQVLKGEDLDRLGANGFQDYLLDVPSVSLRDQGDGGIRIALRGISNAIGSDFGTTTSSTPVGVYLDDVPISATSVLPDLALYDLDRIEVLKGPQGTLYGEGAMGGAIKMILHSPNLDDFQGKGDITVSNTDSGGFNQWMRAALNAPLVPGRVAVRVVGSERKDDGFVDNVNAIRHENNYNDDRARSVRAILLAQLTDNFSARILALRDISQQSDFSDVELSRGDLAIDSAENRSNDTRFTIAGLTLSYDFGAANLSLVSSYVESARDFVPRYPFVSAFVRSVRINEEPIYSDIDTSSVAQEVRLVSQGDTRLKWVAGAFYRNTKIEGIYDVRMDATDFAAANASLPPASQFPDPNPYHEDVVETIDQQAVYGEGSLALTDRWELTAGLRWYKEDRTFRRATTATGAMRVLNGLQGPQDVGDDGVVPKVALSYKAAPDVLLYVLAAKGFRSSLINTQQRFIGDAGATSDSIWNYETGAKTQWLDGRLTVNGSVFYVDWSKIQLNLVGISPVTGLVTGYRDNGGDGEIYGAELEIVARPTNHFLFGLNAGYTHSEMVEVTDLAVARGRPLPNAPQWTGAAFAEYRYPVFNQGMGFVHADVQYVDDQLSRPVTTAEPDGRPLESYALGTLRVGLEHDKWSIAAFADNLWNERAQLGRGLILGNAAAQPDRVSITRPRTIGLSFSVNF
jgi:outer membrane receptor protein involved in Fe transport